MTLISRSNDAKRHGRHYTPTALADFLAHRAAPYLLRGHQVRVLDPACGDGELLLAAHNALVGLGFELPTLVGIDIDGGALGVAEQRLGRKLPSRLIQGNFLSDDLDLGGAFDLIITNPPYVRTQVLGAEIAAQIVKQFELRGRIDLMHAFVAKIPRLLSEDGVAAILCSNRFISTKSGENMRRLLSGPLQVRELYDLGDTKLFSAAVLPAVTIATVRRGVTDQASYVRAYQAPLNATTDGRVAPSSDLFEALAERRSASVSHFGRTFTIESGALQTGPSPQEPWRLDDPLESNRWALVREATWRTIGEVARIRVGIKTTADAVFISRVWDDLPLEVQPEAELLLPLLTHENARAWTAPTNPATRVLYPYDLTTTKRRALPLEDYPRAYRYILQHEARLRGRKYIIEGGREWYEIWVPQKPSVWARPKVVFPDISEFPRFSLDVSGAIVNGDCYWIAVDDLEVKDLEYLIIGVANSRFATEYYDYVCGNKLYSGKRRWMTQYVGKIPLPDPTSNGAQRIVQITRDLCSGERRADPNFDSDAAVSELNVAVNQTFGVQG